MGIEALKPSASLLLFGLLLDASFGDPRYSLHPIRLLGHTLSAYERLLRRSGLSGYAGGCLLFLSLAVTWVAIPSVLVMALESWNVQAASIAHIFIGSAVG